MLSFSWIKHIKDTKPKKLVLSDLSELCSWYQTKMQHGKDGVAVIGCVYNQGAESKALENVDLVTLIQVDVDGEGANYDQAKEIVTKLGFGCVMYTSISHGVDKDGTGPKERYRLVFQLLNPIKPKDFNTFWLGFDALLKENGIISDEQCKNANRLMYTPRLKSAEATLEPKLDYIEGCLIETEPFTISGASVARFNRPVNLNATRSNASPSLKREIKKALKFIPPRREGTGTYGETLAVASAIRSIFGDDEGFNIVEEWSPGFKTFNAFLKLPTTFTAGSIFHYAKKNGFIPEEVYTREVNKNFLEPNDVISDKFFNVTVSTQGTGKTEAISKVVKDMEKVLLIGHRRKLIGQACDRLNLKCYLDEDFNSSESYKRVGICLDSLLKLNPSDVGGILIIDEWTQVLRHLTGDTIKRKRIAILNRLVGIMQASTKIVLLDAINDDSLLDLLLGFTQKTLEDVEITINRFNSIGKGRLVKFHKNTSELDSAIIDSAKIKEPFALALDSKKDADIRAESIKQVWEGCRILLITSETSHNQEQLDWIENPNDKSELYDVVIYTPAISTGVDVQTKRFKKVYGMFQGVISAPDIIQGVRRFRHCETIELFVGSAAWTPGFADLERCLITSGAFLHWPKHELPDSTENFISVNKEGKLVYKDEGYIALMKCVEEHDLKFKRSLGRQVAYMLSRNGFEVYSDAIRTDVTKVNEANTRNDIAKTEVVNREVKATIETDNLDILVAKKLKENKNLQSTVKKAVISSITAEVAQNVKAREELIRLEVEDKVLTAKGAIEIADMLNDAPIKDEKLDRTSAVFDSYRFRLVKWLIIAELWTCLGGITTNQYDQTTVNNLITALSKRSSEIKWVYKLDVGDIANSTRPVSVINKVLRKVLGFDLVQSKVRSNGVVINVYALSSEARFVAEYLLSHKIQPDTLPSFKWAETCNEPTYEAQPRFFRGARAKYKPNTIIVLGGEALIMKTPENRLSTDQEMNF